VVRAGTWVEREKVFDHLWELAARRQRDSPLKHTGRTVNGEAANVRVGPISFR